MLWPEDEAARARWLDAAMTREAAEHADEMSETLLRGAVRLAAKTTPIDELQKAAEDRFGHGWIAGEVLRRAVGRASLSDESRINVGMIIEQIVQGFKPFRVAGKIHSTPTPKTIVNVIWPRYRPVAHLWAAYVSALDSGSSAPWPCSIIGLPVFLATAEEFRKAGEITLTKQGPVLRNAESVRVPNNLALPEVSVQFVPRGTA